MAGSTPPLEPEIQRHIPQAKAYLRRVVRPGEVDDALQIVLERVIQHRANFRGDGSLRAWILGIARNVGLEVARDRQRAPALFEMGMDSQDLAPISMEQSTTAEESLASRQDYSLALAALDELPLEDKLVLLMTYADGLPGPEAAAILDLSPAAFRQRLSRARQSLGRHLENIAQSGETQSTEVLDRWKKLLRPLAEDHGEP